MVHSDVHRNWFGGHNVVSASTNHTGNPTYLTSWTIIKLESESYMPKSPRPMSADAIERAARADHDAQPLTEADLKRMKRTPRAKIIRRALELTQEEFAARYHIPLGTLRDWEQGRAEPDQPTQAYLILIARDPDHVARILNSKPN